MCVEDPFSQIRSQLLIPVLLKFGHKLISNYLSINLCITTYEKLKKYSKWPWFSEFSFNNHLLVSFYQILATQLMINVIRTGVLLVWFLTLLSNFVK